MSESDEMLNRWGSEAYNLIQKLTEENQRLREAMIELTMAHADDRIGAYHEFIIKSLDKMKKLTDYGDEIGLSR